MNSSDWATCSNTTAEQGDQLGALNHDNGCELRDAETKAASCRFSFTENLLEGRPLSFHLHSQPVTVHPLCHLMAHQPIFISCPTECDG